MFTLATFCNACVKTFFLLSAAKVFDREGEDGKFVSVTVKATDSGQPSLEGVCSFTVEITDVNDNPPLFDRQVRTFQTAQKEAIISLSFSNTD